MADYGYGANITGAAAAEGGVHIVRSGGRVRVATDAPLEIARSRTGNPPPGEAQNYLVSIPKHLQRLRCLVEGCTGRALNWIYLWVYFAQFHTQDTIMILEEGNQPCLRCPQCGMFVLRKALNGRHIKTDFCQQEAER